MTSIPLNKTETALLVEAASRGGLLVLPESMKPASAQRLLGKLARDQLVAATEQDGETRHHLTAAGYRAVGLKAPRVPRTGPVDGGSVASDALRAPSKKEQIRALLGREEGATLAELVAATGWLPHTTRAALSRIRAAGTTLAKSTRQDGSTAYRIMPEEPVPPAKRSGRRPPAVAADEVVAA